MDGDIIYRFGRVINPNNTAIRWNGIGLTVIVQHGGGDYSVYGSLSRSDVRKGDKVGKGQVIGAVGRADPDMDAHLHLEIRPKGRATDPLAWLALRAGSR
ncbi:MAG: peptidoglycan DD-metalloendopeptidase family protein [Gemmatimonadetes bacterium]|nr:peptidoglycan DD-metalloendopeptidase family protein [Gemmatimonadota bacterium]